MKFKRREGVIGDTPSSKVIDPSFFYTPANTFIHRLTPVTKIVFLLVTTIYVFVERSLVLLSLNVIMQVVLVKLGKMSLLSILKRLRWIILFTLLMIPLNVIFNATTNQDDAILFYLVENLFPIRRLAVYFSFRTVLVIFILLISTFIILGTTTQNDLVRGMIKLGLPYPLGYSLSVALRYVPIIREDTQKVMLAQKARGMGKHSVKGIRGSLELIKERIITSLLIILKKSESSAISMDLRGFGMSKKRTYFDKLKFSTGDAVFLTVTALLFLFFTLYRFGFFPFLPDMFSLYNIFHAAFP